MSFIETHLLKNSTIMYISSERGQIQLDPPYQRSGDVWPLEKKQLLIDSILNDYDIPKIYFHSFSREQQQETNFTYAVIDGRQRLEAIWGFVDGKFALSSDFEYQKDPLIKLKNLSYDDLAKEFPRIRIQFDSFVLPIVEVITDDEDLIEDMFSRLNEAVTLNAAEKRNAFTGEAVLAIRTLTEHGFFKDKVKISNKRYQHHDMAAKLLFIEDSLINQGKLQDTKKTYLDRFVKQNINNSAQIKHLQNSCEHTISQMSKCFLDKDSLLIASNIVLYYLLFKEAEKQNKLDNLTRSKFADFKNAVSENRNLAEIGLDNEENHISYELLEYERLSQQGTNDASNIRERLRIISSYMGVTS